MIQTDDPPRMMTALLLGEDDEPVGPAFVLRRFMLLDGGLALEFGRDSGLAADMLRRIAEEVLPPPPKSGVV